MAFMMLHENLQPLRHSSQTIQKLQTFIPENQSQATMGISLCILFLPLLINQSKINCFLIDIDS